MGGILRVGQLNSDKKGLGPPCQEDREFPKCTRQAKDLIVKTMGRRDSSGGAVNLINSLTPP